MDIESLMVLKNSPEAPYNHNEYTVWLHNKIIERINYDIWELREKQTANITSSYAAVNKVMSLPSLKVIV